MNFENIDGIKKHGSQGFVEISSLEESAGSDVPKNPGIFLVVQVADGPLKYLSKSIGGHFKKKDPAVPVSELQANWKVWGGALCEFTETDPCGATG